MTDDAELLRCYAETRSESAFAELVQRHLDLVYAAALRRLNGDSHRAADIAQQVFIALARHAASLSRRPVLASWLHTATRHAAIDLIRQETRRASREQHAHAMETLNAAAPATDWEKLRHVLDEAIDELPERYRAIVLLRFFENQSFADVGVKLSINEDAARMRTTRALEKLRELLARRGVTSTAAALGATLAAQPIVAAPAGLALTVTGSALAGAAIAGTTALTTGAFTLMSTTKTILAVAGILTAVAIGSADYETRLAQNANLAVADLQRERDALRTQTTTLETRLHETSTNLARATALQKETEGKLAKAVPEPKTSAVSPVSSVWANPDMVRNYLAKDRATLGLRFGLLYHELHLSPEQISKFEKTLTELRQSLVDIYVESTEHGLSTNDPSVRRLTIEPGQIMEANLRTLLGDSGLEHYRQYEKGQGTREMIAALAGSVYFSEPLTTEQGERLAQVVKVSTETKRTPIKDEGPKTVYMLRYETDWGAVNAQAQGLLSQLQLTALKALIEQKRLQDESTQMLSSSAK